MSRGPAVLGPDRRPDDGALARPPGRTPDSGAAPAVELVEVPAVGGPAGTFAPGSPSPPPLNPGILMGLQRAAGNVAVGRLVRREAIRPPVQRAVTAIRLPVQRAVTPEQATSIAARLREAMAGWGTDEEAIYGALSGRTASDLAAIREAYALLSPTGLDADLRDELTDDELAHVQSLMASATAAGTAAGATPEERYQARKNRARDVAGQLQEAMAGWGTDETQLINALAGRTPYEIVEIAGEYLTLTGRGLEEDVRDELSGDDLARALGPLRTMHTEGEGPNPEIGLLQQALNALGASPAVRITGMFGPETTAALRDFQAAHPPIAANGQATLETWLRIDRMLPRVFRQGSLVYEGPAPAEARGVPTGGTIHPTVRQGGRGAAVEELQQKLLTVPGDQVPTRPTANGTFDAATRRAVREFQGSRTPPLAASGIANRETWAALDAVAGPVNVGREEFAWDERTEGMVMSATSRYTWRLQPDRMEIMVNIRFTGAPNHPMVNRWRTDITNTWNTFKLVDDDHPGTELPLNFVLGTGPADNTVRVHVTPPHGEVGRSDSGNWYTGDTDPGLAPHEFGHLIGLRDEYNQGPEALTVVTGEQPGIGDVGAPSDDTGAPVAPDTIAAEMRTAVTSSPPRRRGGKAKAVVDRYSLTQGAFSQRVAQAYETANAGSLLREDWVTGRGYVNVNDAAGTMANDISARIPANSDDGEPDAVEPFLYSNRSLMGTMESLSSPIGPHDHPIADRHVRHFAELVGRNRPGRWRAAAR